jgi:CBS domain-containing protein
MTKTKAREIMTPGVEYVDAGASVEHVAQMFARDGIGGMPVCGDSGRLQGFVTDRDIVVKVIATGKDPSKVKVGELADQPAVVAVAADDSVEQAIVTMKRFRVRRVPVIDGTTVVGMISQADIARCLPGDQAGDLVAAISSEFLTR